MDNNSTAHLYLTPKFAYMSRGYLQKLSAGWQITALMQVRGLPYLWTAYLSTAVGEKPRKALIALFEQLTASNKNLCIKDAVGLSAKEFARRFAVAEESAAFLEELFKFD